MAKILNFIRIIRNNWKKSVVGTAALSYGVSYSKELYDTEQLMREYCEQVKQYGDAELPTDIKPRHVTVILNPAAKKRKAKKLFERYCEPLLHLAGIAVNIIQTESGSHARNIIMNLNTPTDAIIVAGGDGTLSDVLTGLMRKFQSNVNSVRQCPIGVLPLGEVNTIASTLYRKNSELADVKQLVDATMAVIHNNTKIMDAIEVEVLENESEDDPIKPIYAMGSLKWGAWQDAQAYAKKYWYWGSLKKYVTYVFTGYSDKKLHWNCSATIKYTDPCDGCSKCFTREQIEDKRRWWHAFIPRRLPKEPSVDYSKVINKKCGTEHETTISTTELHIETPNINETDESPKSLKLYLGPENIDYASFVSQGWEQVSEKKFSGDKLLEAKSIELIPEEPGEDRTLFIDNEGYELKAVRIKLLPRAVKIFCPHVDS